MWIAWLAGAPRSSGHQVPPVPRKPGLEVFAAASLKRIPLAMERNTRLASAQVARVFINS